MIKENIVPKRFCEVSYENDVSDEIKKVVVDQVRKSEGVYFWGDSGVGKTHIVSAFCQFFKKEGFKFLFYNTGEFLEMLRCEFDKEESDENLFREVMEFKGILVLDDIGSEKISEWVVERLYLILNKRYEDMLPTLFTSNCDLEALDVKLGGRIASRIAGMTEMVKISGEDYRLKQK